MEREPLRAFLVEDEDHRARAFVDAFAQDGSLVGTLERAARLSDALTLIAVTRPDLVLLDLTLPDALGFEGLSQVQAVIPGATIIVLADEGSIEVARRAMEKGAADFILKDGSDPRTLVKTVRGALERDRLARELDAARRTLRTTQAQMDRLALLDPQTELLNRRGFQHALVREVQWSHRNGSPLLAILLNLDEFKRINNALGHAVGDIVLKEVARKLRGALRATDYAARIGGDEFLVLLPQTRHVEGIRVAEKLRLAVSGSPIALVSGATRVAASVALIDVLQQSTSVEELIAHGHVLLRQARTGGKSRIAASWTDAAGPTEAGAIPRLLAALREPGSFRAVKHPIIRLSDGLHEGFEFLSRASVESFEMPGDFFRVCFEANILTIVDHQCFKTCVSAAAGLSPGLRRHVNLFPSTLIGVPTQQLMSALPRDRAPSSYCVEISEEQILGDPSYLSRPVEALKREGLEIAIDDVGFGRSCLESLILLEPDVVKIDKKCVMGIARDVSRERSLRRLLNIIQSLGADAVAEGVESREDLDVVKGLGIPYAQGYLWGKPSPVS